MTDETIVAVFDAASHAEAAAADLRTARVPEDAIGLHASGAASAPREQGFWAGLFGGEPDHGTELYDHSVERGSVVLTVRTPSEHVDQVMQLLQRHHPIDMEDRAADYGLAPSAEPALAPLPGSMPGAARPGLAPRYADADVADEDAADLARFDGVKDGLRADGVDDYARADRLDGTRVGSVGGAREDGVGGARADGTEDVMQLAEESLQVGKRVVNRGGTRIRRYVVETPVEQSVTLRDERVTLDRHPVAFGRPTAADAFTDKVMEMTETAEEAVVSKTARVVEEVSLRRRAEERVETVRDTVRRQEVAVEQIPATAPEGLPPRPRAPRP